MKRSTYTDSQTMDTLKRVEAAIAVRDLCRKIVVVRVLVKRGVHRSSKQKKL